MSSSLNLLVCGCDCARVWGLTLYVAYFECDGYDNKWIQTRLLVDARMMHFSADYLWLHHACPISGRYLTA